MADDAQQPTAENSGRDYRETVFLPDTPFPMRAGLPQREPQILAQWAELDLYRGIYRDVISTVTPAQVRWACERLAKLSDQQWNDAFRSARYTDEQTRRYTNKIKEKIA